MKYIENGICGLRLHGWSISRSCTIFVLRVSWESNWKSLETIKLRNNGRLKVLNFLWIRILVSNEIVHRVKVLKHIIRNLVQLHLQIIQSHVTHIRSIWQLECLLQIQVVQRSHYRTLNLLIKSNHAIYQII